MSDALDQAKASRCHAADTCVLDDACPFAINCLTATDLDAEFEVQADRAISEILGDIDNWKPTGILNILPPPEIIRPAGER